MGTASHDKTLAVHRMGEEQTIEKTIVRVEVPEKINEIAATSRGEGLVPDIIVGDVSPVISRFVFKS